MTKMMRLIAIATALAVCLFMVTGCSLFEKPLSKEIVGEWDGQMDVSKAVYKGLSDELGVDLSPEPAYCNVKLVFNEDQTGVLSIDKDGFAQAVGECVEPYTSGIFSFDTSGLVSVLMGYISQGISEESGSEEFTYQVNDDNNEVILQNSGSSITVTRNDEGNLEYMDEEDLGQTIVFKKAE